MLGSKGNGDGKVSCGWENGGCKANGREGMKKKKYMSVIMTLSLGMHACDVGRRRRRGRI